MKIYKCTMDELDKTSEFYDRVVEYLDTHINYPKWMRGIYPGYDSTKAAIEGGWQYICTDGGTVAGAFILNDNPQGNYSIGEWSTDLDEGEYLVIHTLAVAPDMYGKGVAKRMVEYCIDAAKEQGYKAVRLDVVPTNKPAKKLYEGMGFKFAGECDLGRFADLIPTFLLYEMNF